jgi:hypothetical protein
MKNLSMLFSLLVIFAVQVDAAPSKAEAEVSAAFTEYFQARQKQDYKTVVHEKKIRAWMQHNIEESGESEHFIPKLYNHAQSK